MNDINEIDLHDNAKQELSKELDRYNSALLYESKAIALIENSDEVQTVHIRRASERIKRLHSMNRKNELLKLVGGTLFGAFFPGFITSIAPLNTVAVVLYTIAGFTGISMVLLGLKD
jgi:hypothetical protein